jgi:hypothetical protein
MITIWNRHHEYKWGLMPVSKEMADKLVAGEFTTFQELEEFENNLETFEELQIVILYRIVNNKNKGRNTHIIETLFTNE